MKKCATAPDAMAFVRQHGIVLVSAKGPAPRLTEAIVGEAIAGSWWAHEKSRHIYATLQAIIESKQVLVCRLVDGKVTLVHRRLWPALVRLADRFAPEQLAQVHDEHTPTGRHVSREVPYPAWVPPHIMARGKATKEKQALAALGSWVPTPRAAARRARQGRSVAASGSRDSPASAPRGGRSDQRSPGHAVLAPARVCRRQHGA